MERPKAEDWERLTQLICEDLFKVISQPTDFEAETRFSCVRTYTCVFRGSRVCTPACMFRGNAQEKMHMYPWADKRIVHG